MSTTHKSHLFGKSTEKPRKKVYDIVNGDTHQIEEKKREIERRYQNCHAWNESITSLPPNGFRLTFVRGNGADLQVDSTVYDFSMVAQGKGMK